MIGGMTRTIEFLCIGTGAALWLIGAAMAAPELGAAQMILMSVPIVSLALVATLPAWPPGRWAPRWPASPRSR